MRDRSIQKFKPNPRFDEVILATLKRFNCPVPTSTIALETKIPISRVIKVLKSMCKRGLIVKATERPVSFYKLADKEEMKVEQMKIGKRKRKLPQAWREVGAGGSHG